MSPVLRIQRVVPSGFRARMLPSSLPKMMVPSERTAAEDWTPFPAETRHFWVPSGLTA